MIIFLQYAMLLVRAVCCPGDGTPLFFLFFTYLSRPACDNVFFMLITWLYTTLFCSIMMELCNSWMFIIYCFNLMRHQTPFAFFKQNSSYGTRKWFGFDIYTWMNVYTARVSTSKLESVQFRINLGLENSLHGYFFHKCIAQWC